MDELDFLKISPSGNASLIVCIPDGTTSSVDGLDLDIFGARCPLLALSFEYGTSGYAKHSIEASSRDLIVRFLRFLYVDDYVTFIDGVEEPCSLLTHAELIKLAEIYEVPELQVAAHVNIVRETELSCSNPNPPVDLCQAIQFVYAHLSEQRALIDTLLHYCVYCFSYHSLGTNEDFRQLAYELHQFHRDLCLTNFHRGFEDDGAADIVRLPNSQKPEMSGRFASDTLNDFLFALWEGDSVDGVGRGALRTGMRRRRIQEPTYTLVHRPCCAGRDAGSGGSDSAEDSDSSISEAEGFAVVHRPRVTRQDVEETTDDEDTLVEQDAADMVLDPPCSATRPPEKRAYSDEDGGEPGHKRRRSIAEASATAVSEELDELVTRGEGDDSDSDSEWSVVSTLEVTCV